MSVINFTPNRVVPQRLLQNVHTGWPPCEEGLADIMLRFNVQRNLAVEFGVDFGFSTSALSNYFDLVLGVDHFHGDEHAGDRELYGPTSTKLREEGFLNVLLERSSWQDWTADVDRGLEKFRADLIHIDARHTFSDTVRIGRWAVGHSDLVLFHDVNSFRAVGLAVERLAEETGYFYYRWDCPNGLGILSKREENGNQS